MHRGTLKDVPMGLHFMYMYLPLVCILCICIPHFDCFLVSWPSGLELVVTMMYMYVIECGFESLS